MAKKATPAPEVEKPVKKTATKKAAAKKKVEVVPEPELTVDEKLQNTADAIVDMINANQEADMLNSFNMPNLVEPSATIIHENDPFKKIEMAGRTCYKSEDAITKESSLKFVKGLMKSKHMAMVEHAVMVFEIDCENGSEEELMDYVQYVQKTDFMFVTIETSIPRILVSGNVRAILERNIKDPVFYALMDAYPEFISYYTDESVLIDAAFYHVKAKIVDVKKLKNLTEDEFMQHFNFTIRFITDRGVTHEMVRHRRFSFAQESTRYCNYSKDKFGGHCTFCKPATFDSWTQDQKETYYATLSTLDGVYSYLTSGENGLQPQQARAILPNTLKTEIVITGPAFEWQHFFNLRSKGTTGAPHPDIKIVADEALKKVNRYLSTLKFDNKFKF